MTPIYKEPAALVGAAAALTGLVIFWKNSFPGNKNDPCFLLGFMRANNPSPEEAARYAQEDADCAAETSRANIGKVVTGAGLALMVVGAVQASQKTANVNPVEQEKLSDADLVWWLQMLGTDVHEGITGYRYARKKVDAFLLKQDRPAMRRTRGVDDFIDAINEYIDAI